MEREQKKQHYIMPDVVPKTRVVLRRRIQNRKMHGDKNDGRK